MSGCPRGGRSRREGAVVALQLVRSESRAARARPHGRAVRAAVFAGGVALLGGPVVLVNATQRT